VNRSTKPLEKNETVHSIVAVYCFHQCLLCITTYQNNNIQCLDVIQHIVTKCFANKTTQFSWVIVLFMEDFYFPCCGFIRILHKNLTFRNSLCKWKERKVLVLNAIYLTLLP